jgi:hypothetical protein
VAEGGRSTCGRFAHHVAKSDIRKSDLAALFQT